MFLEETAGNYGKDIVATRSWDKSAQITVGPKSNA